MPPSFAHRITKYSPAERDERGHYNGAEHTVSDHGPVEAAYLEAIAAFAQESGIDRLEIREPEVTGFVNAGLEELVDGHGLAGLFPPDLTGYYDGAEVSVPVALELVRAMLRDQGAWCRLEQQDSSPCTSGGISTCGESVDFVWEAANGTIRHVTVDETHRQQLTTLVAGARAACSLPVAVDERHPLFQVALPDSDGVLRARW
ncbi:hypothetical protein ABZ499_27310 [Streptomyces sp. NPDC019990]|uniref:hypothetical protein n=1 Tax=Streptomyces sp. NPDC019990 TaxID=3154693 RepID=UPI0033F92006